jgi:hypothetical protein
MRSADPKFMAGGSADCAMVTAAPSMGGGGSFDATLLFLLLGILHDDIFTHTQTMGFSGEYVCTMVGHSVLVNTIYGV